ncbi:hypothetical protein D3C87_1821850 [compost metagenome]
MGNIKNKKKIGKVVSTQDIGSVVKYTDAPFFKKKDEEAIIFLEKHPVPIDLIASLRSQTVILEKKGAHRISSNGIFSRWNSNSS